MYLNTGYLNHSHMDFKDKSRPLIVGSCGTYRLSRHPKLPTYRPRGRLDYQIIYITAGCGHFHFDNVNNETIVPAGNIVLYRPKELQKYEYYGEDKTEVYWIHFTGSNVKNILRQYGFPDKEHVFQVGTSNEYEQIFKRIIIELQRCQDNYEEMLVLLLRHLLISFHRELTREHILKNEYLDHEMDNAVTFFSENYNQNINRDDVKSARPLRPGLHTCYNGGYRRQLHGDVVLIPKASLSSDWSLQPDSMKAESLVIADQQRRGECVPGPCTHRPSSHESG